MPSGGDKRKGPAIVAISQPLKRRQPQSGRSRGISFVNDTKEIHSRVNAIRLIALAADATAARVRASMSRALVPP